VIYTDETICLRISPLLVGVIMLTLNILLLLLHVFIHKCMHSFVHADMNACMYACMHGGILPIVIFLNFRY